ncbi:MAG: tRNA lysidine(34) synthetase TilS [Bacteroidales bacterium]|nr:tRNA lysidine(34) synthetase TilS [Bacteroidales bacterium]
MKILLAVSGGKDSMTMSDLALRAAAGELIEGFERFRGAELGIAHCNFHLRPGDCDADASLVEDWAGRHDLPFHRADFDTLAVASERGISVEMAARELRYDYFARLCREFGYEAVAVAHQADDNAETLLLHLLRGCGLDGACAMAAESVLPLAATDTGPAEAPASIGADDAAERPAGGASVDPAPARPLLLRPLLGHTREEINGYTIVRRVPFREDKSNAESVYQRNLLRNKVFPLFSKINPSAVQTLCRDIENFRRSRRALDWYVQQTLDKALVPDGPNASGSALAVDTPSACPVADAPIALSAWRCDLSHIPEAVLPEVLFRLLSTYGYGSDTVDAVLTLLKEREAGELLTEGRLFHSATHILLVRGGSLRLRPKDYAPPKPVCERLDWQERMPLKQPEGVTVVDADALPDGWVVRPWREGDWMRPLGMGGRRKKLSDLFVDLGFDAFDKADAWVLASPDVPSEGAPEPGLSRSSDGLAPEPGLSRSSEDARSHVLALIGRRIDESVKIVPGRTQQILRFTSQQ